MQEGDKKEGEHSKPHAIDDHGSIIWSQLLTSTNTNSETSVNPEYSTNAKPNVLEITTKISTASGPNVTL